MGGSDPLESFLEADGAPGGREGREGERFCVSTIRGYKKAEGSFGHQGGSKWGLLRGSESPVFSLRGLDEA